jgi:hypothetical protein
MPLVFRYTRLAPIVLKTPHALPSTMLLLKSLIVIFLASIFTLAPTLGQQAPTTTSAPPASGLLLARIAHQRDPQVLGTPYMVRYETLWIVRDRSGAHIAATLPDIIVPRKTGFWHIGIQHTCQFSPPSKSEEADHGNISTADLAYAVPVEKPATLELDYPLCDSATAKRVLDDSYDPKISGSGVGSDAPGECGWWNFWFESVLPDLISVGSYTGQSESCEARGGHTTTQFWVQSPDSPISTYHEPTVEVLFDQLFGPAGHRAWVKAVSTNGAEGDCAEDSAGVIPQTGWSLKHAWGEWYTSAFVQTSNFCSVSGDPKLVVPRSLTHSAPLPVPWSALQKQLPNLADAYVSPDGSVLLAFQSKRDADQHFVQILSVALYDFSGGKVGTKLLDLPLSDLVMVQWATGRFVQSWTDSLTALQSHGLPALIFKVRDSGN